MPEVPGAPVLAADRLCRWAREAGFDEAMAGALGPATHGERYLEWLARGDHAGMDWLGRNVELRLDPRGLFDGARSVVVVLWQYWPLADEPEAGGDLWPGVARYARGQDYHREMWDRLGRVGERLEAACPGATWRAFVDTGPILERDLAAGLGLGATGKNTVLLHRRFGSYFFLGQLLTDVRLTPAADPPGRPADPTEMCKACTLCLDACPTDALPAPYRLNARRCISYWTIEHRGPIPEAMRPELGSWVFGCDICQEVCPWNRRPVQPVLRRELGLPAERGELDLVGLLRISRDDYVRRFRGSAMKRAKRVGLQRNAVVAMGNRADPRYAPALSEALADSDGDPVVRGHAAWALGRIASPDALLALGSVSREALPRTVAEEVERALEGALERKRSADQGPGKPEE